jgi:hypothetical protein
MQIDVEASFNWPAPEQFVFNEIGKPRKIRAIRAEWDRRETICEVTGVGAGGIWTDAMAVKINDSSEGHAFLIYGGEWGIRLKPEGAGPWDLSDARQRGEAFKVYGSEEDIFYADR